MIPDVDEVVSRVLDRLRQSRYTRGVDLDEAAVRKVVDRSYTGIAPWPFRALLD